MPKYCVKCGRQLPEKGQFCPACGAAVDPATKQKTGTPQKEQKKKSCAGAVGLCALLLAGLGAAACFVWPGFLKKDVIEKAPAPAASLTEQGGNPPEAANSSVAAQTEPGEELFGRYVEELCDYATASYNNQCRFVGDCPAATQSATLRELGAQRNSSTHKYTLTAGQAFPIERQYALCVINPDEDAPTCSLCTTECVAQFARGELTYTDSTVLDEDLKAVIRADAEVYDEEESFTYNGITVYVESSKTERKYYVASEEPVALLTFRLYTPVYCKNPALQTDTAFLHTVSAAVIAGKAEAEYDGQSYQLTGDAQNGYLLTGPDGSELLNINRHYSYCKAFSEMDTADRALFQTETEAALGKNASSFYFGDTMYRIWRSETKIYVTSEGKSPVLVVSNQFSRVPSVYDSLCTDLDFCIALETAIANKAADFDYGGEHYTLSDDGTDRCVRNAAGEEILLASNIAQGTALAGIELPVDFIKKLHAAMRAGESEFTFVNECGEMAKAQIDIWYDTYYCRQLQKVYLDD